MARIEKMDYHKPYVVSMFGEEQLDMENQRTYSFFTLPAVFPTEDVFDGFCGASKKPVGGDDVLLERANQMPVDWKKEVMDFLGIVYDRRSFQFALTRVEVPQRVVEGYGWGRVRSIYFVENKKGEDGVDSTFQTLILKQGGYLLEGLKRTEECVVTREDLYGLHLYKGSILCRHDSVTGVNWMFRCISQDQYHQYATGHNVRWRLKKFAKPFVAEQKTIAMFYTEVPEGGQYVAREYWNYVADVRRMKYLLAVWGPTVFGKTYDGNYLKLPLRCILQTEMFEYYKDNRVVERDLGWDDQWSPSAVMAAPLLQQFEPVGRWGVLNLVPNFRRTIPKFVAPEDFVTVDRK